MNTKPTPRFTAHSTLAAIGAKIRSIDLLDPIHQHVLINQKEIKRGPLAKITDALVAILAGANSMVEVNTILRADPALQRAFGREECAEQSVIQATFNACNPDNVKQMRYSTEEILQQQSRAFRHPYEKRLQVLDMDFSGMLCGPKAEGATKGYFSNVHPSKIGHARGRQLGRVIAAEYEEIVADLLFAGNLQLNSEYQALVLTAEQALVLTDEKRQRTVIRFDAGGSSEQAITWLLGRGYHIHTKDRSPTRVEAFAKTVSIWHEDPRHPGRQVGIPTVANDAFSRPVRQVVVRGTDKKGRVRYGMTISTLVPHQARALACLSEKEVKLSGIEPLSYAWAYDIRGGTIEIEIKEDKQGLGITKRQKKRFAAQEMVMLVNALAHNLLVWVKRWLVKDAPQLAGDGLLRWRRDLLRISGQIVFGEDGVVQRIILNKAGCKASILSTALAVLLEPEKIPIELGEL